MKTRLNHVRANVANLQKAVDWYKSVLGFEVAEFWPRANPVYVSFVAEQGAVFSLVESKEYPAVNARFNFTLENIDELWVTLKDKVEVVEELFDTPYGTRKFTIKDPDGNELGFVCE